MVVGASSMTSNISAGIPDERRIDRRREIESLLWRKVKVKGNVSNQRDLR
jgi:hypothetical protein